MSFYILDVLGFGGRLAEEQSFPQQMGFIKIIVVRELRFSIPIP